MTTAARWGTVAIAVALGAIIVAADRGTLPAFLQRLYAFPGGDKVGHGLLFGALAFGATLAVPRRAFAVGRLRVPAAALVVAALVALEEASQARFPGRTLSLADLAASYVGVAGGAVAALALRRRSGHPASDAPAT